MGSRRSKPAAYSRLIGQGLSPVRRYVMGTGVIVGVVALGVLVVRLGLASADVFSSEAETGTLIGDVATTSDNGASGGSAITFGGGGVPTNLQVFTGGNNIALVWDMPTSAVQSVQVFRNNTQIATVSPDSNAALQNAQIGKEYDDNNVTAGSTYQYKVRAILANGSTTGFTDPVSATQPTSSQPVPNITVDTSAAPSLAGYMSTNIVPLLRTWYPKVADFIAFPSYTAPTSYTINFAGSNSNACETSASGSEATISCDPTFISSIIPTTRNDVAALFVHESTHVIQDAADGPSWSIEGGASWASDYFARQNINPYVPHAGDTIGPYTPGAWFIEFMRDNYSPSFPKDLNIAIHNHTYSENLMGQESGGALASANAAWQAGVDLYNSSSGSITGAGGKCLEVANGTVANGTKIVLNSCNSSTTVTNANVTFLSGIGGKCLDDWLGSSTSNPDLYTCNDTTSQMWTMPGDGTIRGHSGGCVDNWKAVNANGNPVKMFTCSGSDVAEQWSVSGNTIKNPATTKCLDDPGSAIADGTALDLYACNGTNAQKWIPSGGTSITGYLPQRWAVTYHDASHNGAFEITSPLGNFTSTDYCLDVTASGTADGTNVQYWDCDQTNAQMWTRGGNNSLVNVNSGKCLDTTGGSTTSGTQLVINTCNGSSTQKWTTP